MAKQQTCQKFVFKIHTKRLVEVKWDLTLPLDEARRNHEIISLADSTVLRWIDELNGVTDAEAKARSIKRRIKMLRNEPSCLENRREIRSYILSWTQFSLSRIICAWWLIRRMITAGHVLQRGSKSMELRIAVWLGLPVVLRIARLCL